MMVDLIGYLAGICLAIFAIPQTYKTIKTKDVESLSLVSYLIYTTSMVLWTTYGYFLNSLPMIIFNLISLVFALIVLYMILKYKKS